MISNLLQKPRLACLCIALAVSACVGNTLEPVVAKGGRGTAENGASLPVAGSQEDTCADTVFAVNVWKKVLAPNCYGCHITHGYAQQAGSNFVLAEPRDPNYMQHNFMAFEAMAQIKTPSGEPMVMAKPSMAVAHQGGLVLANDSNEMQVLRDFIDRGALQSTCMPQVAASVLAAVPLQDANTVAQRAALQLAARMPNANEMSLAASGNLDKALDSMLSDPAFGTLIKRSYEDVFYNDQFNGGNVIGFLYDAFYGDVSWNDDNTNIQHQVHNAWGEAHNADEMAAYIIGNDRPYTEILTGNYMLLNAQGACELLGAGNTVPFKTSCSVNNLPQNSCKPNTFAFAGTAYDACYEFQPAVPTRAQFPVVGVLSDGALFTVYQSTPSNRNRHRAAMVLKTFLGLDILSLGPRISPDSVPPSASSSPTMTVPQCQVCHRVLDGVASSFQNWDRMMQMGELEGIYGVGSGKYADQFSPRLNGVLMPDNTPEPLAWLGGALAADPRFAYTAVTTWYTILTGQPPQADPVGNDPNYRTSLASKLAQNDFFAAQAAAFTQNNFNVKGLIKAIIQSPWYAADVSATAGMPALDHTVRRSPEVLDQAIAAAVGRPWVRPGGDAGAVRPLAVRDARYLLNDFRIGYGGIDSLNTLQRNADMSPAAAAVAGFMASDVACSSVAADFEKASNIRSLFPKVSAGDTPDSAAGLANIRANIVYLHRQLLGEQLAPTDPEVDATLQVFTGLYANHKGNTALPAGCKTAATQADSTFTLNAWIGTVAYLLNDFNFLYQ